MPQDSVASVPELIRVKGQESGGSTALTFLSVDDGPSTVLSYSDVASGMDRYATLFKDRHATGTDILLAPPSGPDQVLAFLGAMAAGMTPALLPEPQRRRDLEGVSRIAAILRALPAAAAYTSDAGMAVLRAALPDVAASCAVLPEPPTTAAPVRSEAPDAPAFLQFTSGSTGTPRGVIITHANLLAGLTIIRDVFRVGPTGVSFGWLPLHHDMGLIGQLLMPLSQGATAYLAPPTWFARDPLQWLLAIDRSGATASGGPPFAYDRLVQRLARCNDADTARLAGLDLSRWACAYVGAEPVSPHLLTAIAASLAPFGFHRAALLPCYGLAEATLFVAGRYLDAAPGARVFYPVPAGIAVRIIDPETGTQRPAGEEGEIAVSGPSISPGYRIGTDAGPSPQAEVGWRRTGDLGRLVAEGLDITGRLKDVVIVHGINHHAIDLEATTRAAHAGLQHGMVVAVGLPGEATEDLIIGAEVRLPPGDKGQAVAAQIRGAVTAALEAAHGVLPAQVYIVRPGELPRTTSGKPVRAAWRARLLAAPAAEEKLSPFGAIATDRAVAIVGMACRFPGADDTNVFWQRLLAGDDLISEVPPDRWDAEAYYDPRIAVPGKMNTRWGGFITDVDRFDASLFGIAPHEAAEMDPQQRLLLEMAWRAFEDAGLPPDRLDGSNTGVFIGISTNDYLQLQIRQRPGMELYNAYTGLGTAVSIAANRLSFTFNLRGPSVAVDTACSSSLTAIHLATRALRNGECDYALAGGVNLILSPGTTVALSQFGMMAPDGRCKVFDAMANGYVRSEGCGLVVLRRLADAHRDGDRVHAVIRGGAIGQDGRSPGITAPNPEAQRWVIEQALADAATPPSAIGLIEAHGTGTAIGDPVELAELARVYGRVPGPACCVGSVKASVGHLEAAAGVASLIKTVRAIRHGSVPPQLHLHELNPRIRLAGTRLEIPTSPRVWPRPAHGRVAAISSFGFGGANAHLIVSDDPSATEPVVRDNAGPWLVPVSARDGIALDAHIEALAQRDVCPGEAGFTLGLHRGHFAHRGHVVAATPAELQSGLRRATRCEAGTPGPVGFLFSGQGQQATGMGRGLYARFPVFRDAFDRCAAAFATAAPHSAPLAEIVFGDDGGLLQRAEYLQPALFAVSVATAALWQSFGVGPAALLGHSLGEIAAAVVAGCFSPEDGMELVTARGRLVAEVAEPGAMAAVELGVDALEERLDAWQLDRLVVAALNAPNSTVISGPTNSVTKAQEHLAAAGIRIRPLATPQAFHSPLMDAPAERLELAAQGLHPATPALPLISNLDGAELQVAPDAAHWRRHLRQPVRFMHGVKTLARLGIRHLVEIGPGSGLSHLAQRSWPGPELPSLHPSLGADADDASVILEGAGALYDLGWSLDWAGLLGDEANSPPRRMLDDLPGHPFRRERHWFEAGDDDGPTVAPRRFPDAGWVHATTWDEAPLPETFADPADPARGWIIIGDGRGVGTALAARLGQPRHEAFHVTPYDGRRMRIEHSRRNGVVRLLLPGSIERSPLGAALNEIVTRLAPPQPRRWSIIIVTPLDCPATDGLTVAQLEDAQSRFGPGLLTAVAQAALQTALGMRLWLVTAGAQPAGEGQPMTLSAAPVWGFGNALFLEHPEARGGIVDLCVDAPCTHTEAAAAILDAVLAEDGEPLCAFRGGKRLVPRLRAASPPPVDTPPELRADASYLVTGGLGGLGLCVAAWLHERGAGQIVLLSRRGLPPEQSWDEPDLPRELRSRIEGVRALIAAGASVRIVAADVADAPRLGALFAALEAEGRPLRGVVHAAGENRHSRIAEMPIDQVAETLRAKVPAAWTLHQLTRDRPMDLFVLFSSVAATWGSVNLAYYAAANAFLEALAAHRSRAGLPATCIAWGPWASVGMVADGGIESQMARLGLRLLPSERCLRVMEGLVANGTANAVVVDLDWSNFRHFVEFSTSPRLFAPIARSHGVAATRAVPGQHLAAEIARVPAAEALSRLMGYVRQELAAVILLPTGREPDPHERFNLMGMDSLMAIAFALRLEAVAGQKLPTTLAYNFPTISDVAGHLFELIRGEAAPGETGQAAPVSGPWFRRAALDGEHLPVLFCLPWAGAGASVYAEWAARFAGVATLVAVQPPGREDRTDEPAFTSMGGLADDLARALIQEFPLSRPFAVFGHSLGGLAAFELARCLRRRGAPLPGLLCLSGCVPPRPTAGAELLHAMPDEAFRTACRQALDLDKDMAANDAVWQTIGPVLRADMTVLETYHPAAEAPLPIRTQVIGARRDPLVPPTALSEWSAVIGGKLTIDLLDGGHMLLCQQPGVIQTILRRALAELVPSAMEPA